MRCFLIGHSDAPTSIRKKLKEEVERHVRVLGVTDFVVGQYGAFDRMAAGVIDEVKREYPEITLGLLLAYYPVQNNVYGAAKYDYTVYPPNMESIPYRVAIVCANRYMIRESDYIIAYAWKTGSNACKLLEFAHKQKKGNITELKHEEI